MDEKDEKPAWEQAFELRKQIYHTEPVRNLRFKNYGFFCQFDQEFCCKTGLNIRRPNYEMMHRFLKNPEAMIQELLLPIEGWRY